MKLTLKIFGLLCIIGIVIVITINIYIINKEKGKIDIDFEGYDYALILGAAVWGDGPSPMLEDRVLTGIKLYKDGKVKKLIMSGDGLSKKNETKVMMEYAINKGIPKEDIIIDKAGLSTYDSFKRLEKIDLKKVVIISQDYHLYRAIYDAEKMGIDAVGVNANIRLYAGQTKRDLREVIARCKDYVYTLFKIKGVHSEIDFEFNEE